MVTSGFFNSLKHDRRYNADQVSSMFDGLILEGTFATYGRSLVVKSENDGKDASTTVYVSDGKAWYRHIWILNDAILPLNMGLADIVNDRYDAVVLEVDHSESVRAGSIKVIKGIAEKNPKKPAMINTEKVLQVPLCYIRRPAGRDNIDQTLIENRVGTSDNPFVTAMLQVISTDKLLEQWRAQFDIFLKTNEKKFDTWTAQEIEKNKQFMDQARADLKAEQDIWRRWIQQAQIDFDKWFADLKMTLSGDVAGNLLVMIQEVQAQLSGKANVGLTYVFDYDPSNNNPVLIDEVNDIWESYQIVPGMVGNGTAIMSYNVPYVLVNDPNGLMYMGITRVETMEGKVKFTYHGGNNPECEKEEWNNRKIPIRIDVIF